MATSVTWSASVRVSVLALAWGSTFLWIKRALEAGLTSTEVTTARCVIGAACLLLLSVWQRAGVIREARVWRDVVVAALLCNTLPFLLFSLGQRTVASGTAGILNATTPLWAMLIGLVLGTDRRRPWWHFLGLLLGFAGVVMLLASKATRGSDPRGALLIAAAALSYAVAFAWMGRRLSRTAYPTSALSAAQLAAASVLSVIPLLTVDPRPLSSVSLTHAWALLPLGVVCTALSFHLTFVTITREGATNAAAVGYLLPVVALLLGALFADERVSAAAIAGVVLILLGVALSRRPRHHQPPTQIPDPRRGCKQ